MDVFRHLLRRVFGEQDLKKLLTQMLKFGALKIPITALSMSSLWAIRTEFAGMFYAGLANSLLTQAVEFLVLRGRVFNNHSSSKAETAKRFAIFWILAFLLATMEGALLHKFEVWGWNYLLSYFVAHVPTFLLRFLGDKRIVFRKTKSPGSS